MKNQARREEPEETGDSQPDAPEALRFPPRPRPTTQHRQQQDEPYDAERVEQERAAKLEAISQRNLEAEQARERAEREKAVRAAQAAVQENRSLPELDSVVWEAHEAIQSAREVDPDSRPNYVPIAKTVAESQESAPHFTSESSRSIYVAPYNLPEHSPAPKANALDVIRRCFLVLFSAAFVYVSAVFLGWGLDLPTTFGRSTAALAPLSLAGLAWPLTAFWLLAASIHAWWPDQRSARRQRSVGPSLIIAAVGGAGWCLAAAYDLPWVALLASLAILVAGITGVHQLNLLTPRNRRERWFTDAPLEATVGWGAFAACWSASAAVADWGITFGPAPVWGVLAIVAALVPIFLIGASERGRLVPSITFAWGAFWLMLASMLGGAGGVGVMVVALLGTIIAFFSAMARRHGISSAERNA